MVEERIAEVSLASAVDRLWGVLLIARLLMTRLRGLSGVAGMLDGPSMNFFLGFGRGESSDSVMITTHEMEEC